jgi:hypothetical protein
MPHGNRATLNNITAATRVLAADNAFEQRLTNSKRAKNQSWDAVNVLSSTCAQLLVAGRGMMPSLKNPLIRKHVEDIASLDANAAIVARELTAYATRLLEFRKQHEGKTGNAQGDDENMLAINVFTEYVNWTEQFNAIVQPTINHMLEIIRVAEGKLREEDNDAADAIGVETSMVLGKVLGHEPQEAAPEVATENTDPAASPETVVDNNPTE